MKTVTTQIISFCSVYKTQRSSSPLKFYDSTPPCSKKFAVSFLVPHCFLQKAWRVNKRCLDFQAQSHTRMHALMTRSIVDIFVPFVMELYTYIQWCMNYLQMTIDLFNLIQNTNPSVINVQYSIDESAFNNCISKKYCVYKFCGFNSNSNDRVALDLPRYSIAN